MINPDNRVYACLAALNGNRDFEAVKEWLQASLEVATENCINEVDGVRMRMLQGEARTLKNIIDQSDSSEEAIREINKGKIGSNKYGPPPQVSGPANRKPQNKP